jgi:hypothetical protein
MAYDIVLAPSAARQFRELDAHVRHKNEAMTNAKYPPGWNKERVQRVLEHYATQSDDKAVSEDEATYDSARHAVMEVPIDLVPAVRELIARRKAG